MHHVRPFGRVAVAILAAALGATTVTASAATPLPLTPASACPDGWSTTPNPLTATNGQVLDVSVGPTGAWLVGIGPSPSWRPIPMTANWDGTRWNAVALPPLGDPGALASITARGRFQLWAVGELDGLRTNPLIERYGSGAWHTVATPVLPNGAALTDVASWGTARAWAVGYSAPRTGPRMLAMRWSGTAWSVASPPALVDSALTGVAGVAANDTWSVGWVRKLAGFRPLIEHWDGSSWTRAKPAGVGGPDAVLTDLAVHSATDAWAVGFQGTQNAWSPLVLRWNGLTWTKVAPPALPVPVSMSLLRAVAATPSGIVAVGTVWDPNLSATRSMVARWNGVAWNVTVDAGGESSGDLMGIGADTTTTWAVGHGSKTGLTLMGCAPGPAGGTATPGRVGPGTTPGPSVAADQDETGRPPRPVTNALAAGKLAAPVPPPPGLEVRDVAAAAGLAMTTHTYGGTAADMDGDGWPDLLIGRHGLSPFLGRNVDGQFQPTIQGQIPLTDRHGCAIGDVDGDGHPDITCVHGAAHGLAIKSNELYLSPWTGPVVNTATVAGIADPFGRGREVTLFDANHDGLLDLYSTADPSRIDGLPSLNHLFLNRGGGRFLPAPTAGIDLPMGGTCVVPGDLDGDGWTDLLVCGYVPLNGSAGIKVFHNSRGHFTDVTAAVGITPLGESSAAIADMNGDGTPDIVQLAGHRLRVSLQRNGVFRKGLYVAVSAGASVGVGDADGNGTMDLYVVNGKVGASNAADLMLLNAGNGIHFTSIRVPQTKIGAGESVVPVDHDRNGKTDFVVLNGANSASGPIQLIAFGPPWPVASP